MRDKPPTGIAPRVHECRSRRGREQERCYLELMSIAMFKGGLNYDVVNAKWDGIRDAFHRFDVDRVAAMTVDEIAKVRADPRVIHNARKIEGVVHNAREMRKLREQYGRFSNWLDSIPDPEQRVTELHRHFVFMGPTTAYYFLHYAGEPIPGPHEWGVEHPAAVSGSRKRKASARQT